MRSLHRSALNVLAYVSVLLCASGSLFAAPSITNLNPNSGASGTSVVISGSGFGSSQGTSKVTFGGVTASVTNWSSGGNSITATVPSGLVAGSVNVVVNVGGTNSNSVTFTVTNPLVSSLSINSAPVGQAITINGSNFGSTQGSSSVTFNGTSAIPSFWNTTSIVVPVPTGATTGNIVVTVNGNASPGYAFMVTPAPQAPGVHFIQGNYSASQEVPSSVTVPFPIEQNAGDLNVVVIGWRGAYNVSVADTSNNTYALAVGPTSFSSWTQAIYYAKNISGAADNSVTVTFTQKTKTVTTEIAIDVRIAEYSGLDTNSPFDVAVSGSGTSNTADSGFVSTTNQNDVLVGSGMADGVIQGAGSNYALRVIPINANVNNSDILEDRIVTATGSYDATAQLSGSKSFLMQMVAFKEAQNQAPVVNAGPNQTITLPTTTATLNGTATDDGLPNNTLTIQWSQVSGPTGVTFSSPNTAVTQATFPGVGTYVLQLSASDGQLSSSATTTVTVNSTLSLTLSPTMAGPDVVGSTQTMTAVLKTNSGPTGTPITGASVAFTVTGANATSGSATTDATGTATFTYPGANSGNDTVQATYSGNASNTATVSWLVPSQAVSTTTAFARFFPYDSSGVFDATPSMTPAFTQFFPTINFNPPAGTIPGNNSGVGVSTHPWTDVVTDNNGNFTGTIAAQGNGLQAGVGSLVNFQVVLTGTLTIPQAGNITFNFYTDDGFILGIGGNATHVSGAMRNVPPSGTTPFTNLPVVGAYNVVTAPAGNTEVVNFPAPGTYDYEIDYFECCGPPLVLTMAAGANSTGVPPSGAVTLSPISPTSQNAGQTQTFTVGVTSASGAAFQNAAVNLTVTGANQRQLSATTDATGQATFIYTGTNAGTDTIEASAVINGMGAYSNAVNMTWTVPAGGGVSTFVPQGWIGSPSSGFIAQGQVPITVASGETLASGTLSYWPTSSPASVTILNSNTTGSGTIGTFDATKLPSGGYTIQLNATDSNNNTQVSQITVTVVGSNKPGRIKTTVMEFKVPLAGIPITISRTYDSLEKNQIEDFGYGWKLNTTVGLTVDSKMNVTFDFDGQRHTFYFTPQPSSFWFAWLQNALYTPEPGFHGSLISDGCPSIINVQGSWQCFGPGLYQPTVYQYTDPVGRSYVITASGQLQSIKDLNGNTITVTANGITSSVGNANVTFQRDGAGRVTDIYDTLQNHYQYSYDTNGNLQSVQYPGLSITENYTYASDHSMLTEQDPRGNSSSAVYYDSTNDGGNPALDGRLKSVAGPAVPDPSGNGGTVNFTTQYAYNLSTNTTTITNPDGGTVTRQDDSFGNPLSVTDQVTSGTSRTTTYQYDSNENLIKLVRPCGNATCTDSSGNGTWVYTYDTNGFQTSIQAPGLPADSKTYNQFGGITSQTDAANTNTITTQYDSNFNPIQVTDTLNGTGGSPVATYSNYNAFGNAQDTTDANGNATHYDYYQTGPSTGYLQDMIIFNLNNVQEKTSYTYDAMGKVLTVTDACGNGSCPDVTVAQGTSHTTTNTYDQLERLSTATDASGSVTKYLYDNNGNKTDEYDAYGTSIVRHTHWDYDNLNRAIKITYNDGTTKQFLYDWRGNKTQETDQLGHITKYFYDLAGQLASVTSAYGTADSGTVSDTYDLDGRQQTITDENNQSTGLHATNTYDAAGRLINVQDALGNSTSYGYDADGRRTSLTEPNNQQGGLSTTYAYDPRNRLKTTTYPPTATQPATTMQYTYDGMGRVLTSQDQNGNITTKTYDNVGRLTSVKDAITPNGNLTSYQYDLNGNLTLLTDANQHKTQYQYDTMNRRLGRTLPLGQSEAYSYDPLGRLQSKLDFNGKTTQYNYDSMDRLLSKVPDSSLSEPTINFTYTSGGQLCSASGQRCTMTDASGTTNYGPYDNRDRLLVKATPEGTLTYTYDAHGNVTGIKSSNTNGAWMTYQNDALNRLSQVCDKLIDANCAGAGITTYAYDATGNLAGYVYPNTVQTQNIFDPLDRLTQTCSATGSPACSAGTKLSSYSYGLAPAGNRLAVTELNGRQVLYSYDNDYRLNSEAISGDPAGNNSTTQYIYDPFGNRQQLIVNGVTANTYTYDANDRLTTDGYDANGNTTASAGTSNTYDFENRMLTHGSLTLTYDGDGNRVWETVGGTTTKYLVDDHNPSGLPQVLDELVNGSVTRTYAYGPQRITETQLIGGNWTASLYGYDGHGNVRFLTNSAGAITDSYDFDTFGMPIRASGTTPNQFLYSGERYDSSAGLYDLRARYYNQATGRFWAMDRWEGTGLFPITLNKYIYTGNDPVDGVDPLGFGDAVEYPTITFQVEHFALRHLIGAGLNPAQVQAAVTTAINTIAAAGGVASIQGWFWGTVQSGGLTLVYRAFPIALGKIIVGTIYPGP